MNKLQKKFHLSFYIIIVLHFIFFYLFYLEYRGEKKLLAITQTDKIDKQFKKQTQQLFDSINNSQSHFNKYILFREISDLQSYNQSLVNISSNLNKLVTNADHSASLRSMLKNNILLNKDLIALKNKIDSLTNDKSIVKNNFDLNSVLKLPDYQFEDVLNSVEFVTDKKIDSVKKKGFFSRLGSAVKGETDVQKEEINSVLKLKFGKKVVSGDIKQQIKNVLIESQKHYKNQFNTIGNSLFSIKKSEKDLIQKNKSLVKLYHQINKELASTIDEVLDNNTEKINFQTKSNKELRLYLMITVILLIFTMLFLLLKYINETFKIKYELSQAKDQIAKDLFLKNRIITTLSHEIKTPINIINLYSSIIKNNSDDDELWDTIIYTSHTLTHISNQVVELVRNNENEIKLNLESIDLAKESTSIINSLKMFAESKNINLNFDNQLPEHFEVQYDKAKFYQLVYNIVGNAIKFAKSTIDITIKSQQLKDGEQLVFIVKDDGIGISANDKEHLFDLEYQSKNNKSKDALSFGLGLYICKSIVSASQGEIYVTSELNKGTEISFNLKLKK